MPAPAARELTKPKAGDAEPSANWGPLFTKRVLVRKRLGRQITPTSKFSLQLWLTTQRDFQAKMGKTAETHRPQALPYRQFGARTGFAIPPSSWTFLRLSVYLCAFG